MGNAQGDGRPKERIRGDRDIVGSNSDFRERLAHCLRSIGHHVITTGIGERAFVGLQGWSRPIDWLYTRAALPGLIDSWILADEYHETHRNRAAVIPGI
jgi:hypothetical protein